jgi:hypothetical protein
MTTATQDAAEQEQYQKTEIDTGDLNGCVFRNDPNYCRNYPRWKCRDFC